MNHSIPKTPWTSVAAATASQPNKPGSLKTSAKSQSNNANSPLTEPVCQSRNYHPYQQHFNEYSLGSILAILFLESGHLVLTTDTEETKTKILQLRHLEIGGVSPQATVRLSRYTILDYEIPVSLFGNNKKEEGVQLLYEHNPNLIPNGIRILRFIWHKGLSKFWEALIFTHFGYKTCLRCRTLIYEGLCLDGELKEVEMFGPERIVTHCLN